MMDYSEIQDAIERELKTSPYLNNIPFYMMRTRMGEMSTTPSKRVSFVGGD